MKIFNIMILALSVSLCIAHNNSVQSDQSKKIVAVVCGAGGFIGHHLVKGLKAEGYWVRGVDLKYPEFSETYADEFIIGDLRDPLISERSLIPPFPESEIDHVYQLAADVGGIGYLASHDSQIMSNSIRINVNMLEACMKAKIKKIFFSSSSCVYPQYNQNDQQNFMCKESEVYPAFPDMEYGWEKLFSERLYLAYARDYGMDVKIGRFFNIFGSEETWDGGREKVVAALSRKIARAADGDEIEIWGSGDQTRSFLYVDECVQSIIRLVKSDFVGAVNLGSNNIISINALAELIIKIAGKVIKIKNVDGPQGVSGKQSDNSLIVKVLNWSPSSELGEELYKTYIWVHEQVEKSDKGKNV